ncbi:MAG TPA: CDP-diacylglycerol--glycerol-3-phosphate 3-phosphatidyltransferase [Candidatus Dormibacteraeota bacterium]|nr:CDP-diacylglycerol--glycerol-3-phosphate 3-phosphatidyltransferase [Candidatus Dormibacteraeota bacterium]
MNIPNALTLSRLVAIPILMALLLVRFSGHDQVAAALFIVFSLTDTLDGQLARRTGTVSDLGKFLDPLADKLFVLSVLIVLVQEGLVAAWVVVVIFSRELIITILRAVGASQGRVIAAAPLGKTKTVMQIGAVTLLILQRPYPVLVPFADIAVAVAVVFTLGSGVDYLWRFRYLVVPIDTRRVRVASGGAPEEAAPRELAEVLHGSGLTVSVAESMTGGMIGSLITDQAGSSEYFIGGVIAYSNDVKRDQLGVSGSLLSSVGAVSREVAEAMAEGARSHFGTSLAVAVTGIAGPDAAGTSKPVGLTYIAVTSAAGTASREFRFTGDRAANRRQAARESLRMLIAEARSVREAVVGSA